jgi:hypothetical protein
MAITKVVTILLAKNCLKLLLNWIKRKLYFRKVRKAAENKNAADP